MTFDCAFVQCTTQTSHLTTTIRGLDGKVLRVYNLDFGEPWDWVRDYVYRDGQLLASVEPDGVGGEETSHFHLDHLGSPRQITDGSAVETAFHTYYPFGGEATDPGQDEVALKFTGHERDKNGSVGAGRLDYMHSRYCSPALGRFLTIDPVVSGKPAVPQSWNSYAYVSNNPLIFADPNGRSKKRVHVAHTRMALIDLGFSTATANVIAEANVRSDRFPHRLVLANHATSLFLSDRASNARGSRFARRKLQRAIRQASRGKTGKALGSLGRALHAAEDVISHRGIGNVSMTVLQSISVLNKGERWRRHDDRDESLRVTDTGDPMSGDVEEILRDHIHDEIMASLTGIAQDFLNGLDAENRDAILYFQPLP
ncbi:MAG: RHS repeat-associated core domain-containing protein [bacterium]|nr:RHS repeat-associated core domain-containing protein [bacterium]